MSSAPAIRPPQRIARKALDPPGESVAEAATIRAFPFVPAKFSRRKPPRLVIRLRPAVGLFEVNGPRRLRRRGGDESRGRSAPRPSPPALWSPSPARAPRGGPSLLTTGGPG